MRALLPIVLLACTDAPTDDPACDDTAGAFLCDAPLALAIGTGERAFVDLPGDGGVQLVRGPQGLQHVTLALRAPWQLDELPLDRATVRVVARRGGVEVGERVQAGLQLVADGPTVVVTDLRWVVPVPDDVLGQRVTLFAELAPVGADASARGAREVVVSWAPGEE